MAEELDDPRIEVDRGFCPVLLPAEKGESVDPELSGNVLLAKAKFEPALLEMLPKASGVFLVRHGLQ